MESNETTIHVQNCGFYDEEEGMDLEGLPPFAQADSCNTKPDDCDEKEVECRRMVLRHEVTVTPRIDQNSQYRFPLDSSEAIGVRN